MPILGLAVGSTSRPVLASQRNIAIHHQGVVFGARTRAGAGAAALHHSGTMTSLAKTGGGTAAGEWQVIGNRLAPAQDGGLTDGGTVELVANAGRADEAVFTVSVTVVDGRFDVDSFAEPWPQTDSPQLVAAWEAAADGDTIVARDSGVAMSAVPDCEILADRTAVVRGEAVQFELRFNNGPKHRLYLTSFVKWTFGTDDYTFDALPPDSEVRPGRSALHDYGPLTVHVFESGPSHAVSAEVRMFGGRTGVPPARVIEVVDPDTIFAGQRTIVWTTDGDATGAPQGSAHVTSAASGGDLNGATIYDAIAAANAIIPRGRLLLKGGQTTQVAEFTPSGLNDRLRGIYVDSFGTGKHTWASAFSGTAFRQILRLENNASGDGPTFRNQILQGRYDAAAPGEFDTDAHIQFFSDQDTTRGTFFGVECSGLHGFLILAARSVHSIVNCAVTNWADYGVFAGMDVLNQQLSPSRKRFRGCKIAQKTDVVRRPSNNEMIATYGSTAGTRGLNVGGFLNWAIHGPLRLQTVVGDSVTQCRLESHNGWSDNTNDAVADQPAIRLNSTGNANAIRFGIRTAISGNHLVGSIAEGGGTALGWGSFAWPMPLHQIAFNTWKGKSTGRTTGALDVRVGQFALWNNVSDAGDVAWPDPNGGGFVFHMNPYPAAQGYPAAMPKPRLFLFHNTAVDNRPRALSFSMFGVSNPDLAELEVENNLFFSTTSTPQFSSFGEPLAPDYEVPAGSSAFEGATGTLVAPVDRDGNVQGPGTASLGAVQAQAEGAAPEFVLTPGGTSATAALASPGQDNFASPPMAIGAAEAPDRKVIVIMWAAGIAVGSLGEFSSVTIGGVPATRLSDNVGIAFNSSHIWMADLPTGTTASVVATRDGWDANGAGCTFALFGLAGAASASVPQRLTVNQAGPMALDVIPGDFVLGWHKNNPSGAAAAPAFSGDFTNAIVSAENRTAGTANRDYRAFSQEFETTRTTEGAVTNLTNTQLNMFVLRPSAS